MDLYNTIAGWTGWPAIVAILIILGGYAYWVMHRHIELLKDENEWQSKNIANLKESSPDILAQRLADRVHILNEELSRLNEDNETNQEIINTKESELKEVKGNIIELEKVLDKAEGVLNLVTEYGLVCPKCGAPLETREYHTELVESGGYEVDVDHEIIKYECGLEISDGKVRSKCSRSSLPD
jgi:DNA repair exonuclease SbcCD ATPase subunit